MVGQGNKTRWLGTMAAMLAVTCGCVLAATSANDVTKPTASVKDPLWPVPSRNFVSKQEQEEQEEEEENQVYSVAVGDDVVLHTVQSPVLQVLQKQQQVLQKQQHQALEQQHQGLQQHQAGFLEEVQQVPFRKIGYLSAPSVFEEPLLLPLYGRPLHRRRDLWQYYTTKGDIQLPVRGQDGKLGNEEYGCDRWSTGDRVFVDGYPHFFDVRVYDSSLAVLR